MALRTDGTTRAFTNRWHDGGVQRLDITELRSERLVLEPLRAEHATEMVGVLADAALYSFTGGEPPSLPHLLARYEAQVAGPEEPDEHWHNWVIRLGDEGAAVGFVQTTIEGDSADVAWVVGVPWQGEGIAREAAGAMCTWLWDGGVARITAHIHPEHAASAAVAVSVGLAATGEFDDDGEQIWLRSAVS